MYKNYQVLVFPPYNKYYVLNFVNMALRWLRKTILNIKNIELKVCMLKASMLKCNGRLLMVLSIY